MKKVINVNFQGRVIPIEESAQEMPQRYIDSLRKYFAAEEGAEEIINDIEGRIAELFSERLKKGNICTFNPKQSSSQKMSDHRNIPGTCICIQAGGCHELSFWGHIFWITS